MKRYAAAFAALPRLQLRFATALRETFAQGYRAADFQADLMAGLITGVVALPLSMALAIAVGVPPQHGLYTAIVAGGLIALLGGARTSVSGPTAAFVVILAPIAAQYGIGGLALASAIAGLILILMGAARLGRLIQFIPHPVTTGFTSGIAVVIATLQVKDFLGLEMAKSPDHFIERIAALAEAMPSLQWADVTIGVATLTVLIVWPRITRKVPAPLVALSLAGIGAYLAHLVDPDFTVATINSKFSYLTEGVERPGIPQTPPGFTLPWFLPGPDGEPLTLSFELVQALIPPAIAIAVLGAIESLLCAVVADGMTGRKHDPDVELIAQGVGNVAAPFFGGFAATAAIARTATGIRAGARSPIAPMVHAAFVLVTVLLLAPVLGYLPMASLAALLLMVAWNMSEVKHFGHILRVAPVSDVVVLVTCFALTVIFDMVLAVSVGVVLAALLFMRRMAEIASVRLSDGEHPQLVAPLPPGILLYEVAGPMFFGAAEKAVSTLTTTARHATAVILYMGAVPSMDVTALVALESAIRKLQRNRTFVVLAGVQPQPAEVLRRAGIVDEPGRIALCRTLEEAEVLVRLVADDVAETDAATVEPAAAH